MCSRIGSEYIFVYRRRECAVRVCSASMPTKAILTSAPPRVSLFRKSYLSAVGGSCGSVSNKRLEHTEMT